MIYDMSIKILIMDLSDSNKTNIIECFKKLLPNSLHLNADVIRKQ